MCGCRHFCIFEIFCVLLQPFWKISQTVVRSPMGIFLLWVFGGSHDQFPGAGSSLRSDAGLGGALDDVLDESCDGDVEDELVPELDDNPGTTTGTTFPFCTKCLPLFGYPWLSAAGPLTGIRVFQVVELLACHRVFALSRRDQDRERLLVLLHSFAFPCWPLPPLWGSWISAESPFRLSSKPSCSACALMLRSQPRLIVP